MSDLVGNPKDRFSSSYNPSNRLEVHRPSESLRCHLSSL